MKKVFIINPNTSKDEKYHLMQEIKENFKGEQIIIEKTKEPRHATFIAQKYALKKEEPVHMFACGGDGLLHEVVNGIVGADHIHLSVVPIGTGNDFIKSFESMQREDFLNFKGYQNPIDITCDLLKVNGEYAINTVSFGFDVYVAEFANYYSKTFPVKGIVPYFMGMLSSLTKPLSNEYRIQIDDMRLKPALYSFLVFCNGRYYGGGYKPCPEALVNDGIMDVCLIKSVKKSQILRFATAYQEGKHIDLVPGLVSTYSANTVHIDTDNKEITCNLDGEIRKVKNPTIEIVSSAIHLVLPHF
jgi:YegS/Rv2252/BmrU family lipid kinase